MYPPKIGEELEGGFLGHSPYLELKSEGDRSRVRTLGTSRDVADELDPQDSRRMAKARLLELQSRLGERCRPSEERLKPMSPDAPVRHAD